MVWVNFHNVNCSNGPTGCWPTSVNAVDFHNFKSAVVNVVSLSCDLFFLNKSHANHTKSQ